MGKIRSWITRWLFAGAVAQGAADVVTEPAPPEGRPEHRDVRFEPVDVDARKVLYTGIGVVVGMGLITLSVLPFYKYFEASRARNAQVLPSSAGYSQVPPEPRLQSDPRRDLGMLRLYEDGRLSGYGWVDKAHGLVTLPIERAMELVVQRGIPAQKAPPGNTYFNPHEGSRETGFDSASKGEGSDSTQRQGGFH
jgi:hypothetical protein